MWIGFEDFRNLRNFREVNCWLVDQSFMEKKLGSHLFAATNFRLL